MPPGLQVVTATKVSLTGGSFESLSAVSGDSLSFFNVPIGSSAFIAEIWAVDNLHAMEVEITASRFHDQVAGIRASVTSGAGTAPVNRSVCISPIGVDQPIFPSDTMTIQVNGTASDDAIVTLVVYYPDIPGIHARLATPAWVQQNTKNIVGINTNITPGDGVVGTTVNLNTAESRLHANTDYALLGYTSNLAFGTIMYQGVDTGNLRVGGPVLAEPSHDSQFFYDLAVALNGPYIPIINSNNQGSITIAGVGTDVGACVVDTMLAELKVPFTG